MPSWLKTAFLYASAFATAALFSTACDPSYGITTFRCDPGGDAGCPDKYGTGGTYICCSDDPTALDPADLDAAALPSYGGGSGVPLFSGAQNDFSRWGFCIDTSQVPADAGIPDAGPGMGCPMPCNPTWSSSDITAVCGTGTSCCATVEIEEKDCILDPGMGDNGCYRPARGDDITGFGGTGATNWSGSAHATHQDPNGKGCQEFANANAAALGIDAEDARLACIRKLTVADQRGFCQGAMDCPLANPSYIDACETLNATNGLTGCDA